jgi:nicotinate phosphoribosyltransferase
MQSWLSTLCTSTPIRSIVRDAGGPWNLVPVWRNGKQVYDSPPLADLPARAQAQLGMLHPGIKRFVNPHTYPAGLDPVLHERRTKMILQARAA